MGGKWGGGGHEGTHGGGANGGGNGEGGESLDGNCAARAGDLHLRQETRVWRGVGGEGE